MAAPGSEGASAAATTSSAAIGFTFSKSLLVPPTRAPGRPPALPAAPPVAAPLLELAAADPAGVAPCLPEVEAASLQPNARCLPSARRISMTPARRCDELQTSQSCCDSVPETPAASGGSSWFCRRLYESPRMPHERHLCSKPSATVSLRYLTGAKYKRLEDEVVDEYDDRRCLLDVPLQTVQ